MSFKKLFDIIIYETDKFEVNQDWEVPIEGFFILAPKRKVRSITEFSDEEAHELVDVLRKIREAMRRVLGIDQVYIFQEEKTKFGFHVWVLPRYGWMSKIKDNSLRGILKYAEDNLKSADDLRRVKEAAHKVKKYLSG